MSIDSDVKQQRGWLSFMDSDGCPCDGVIVGHDEKSDLCLIRVKTQTDGFQHVILPKTDLIGSDCAMEESVLPWGYFDESDCIENGRLVSAAIPYDVHAEFQIQSQRATGPKPTIKRDPPAEPMGVGGSDLAGRGCYWNSEGRAAFHACLDQSGETCNALIVDADAATDLYLLRVKIAGRSVRGELEENLAWFETAGAAGDFDCFFAYAFVKGADLTVREEPARSTFHKSGDVKTSPTKHKMAVPEQVISAFRSRVIDLDVEKRKAARTVALDRGKSVAVDMQRHHEDCLKYTAAGLGIPASLTKSLQSESDPKHSDDASCDSDRSELQCGKTLVGDDDDKPYAGRACWVRGITGAVTAVYDRQGRIANALIIDFHHASQLFLVRVRAVPDEKFNTTGMFLSTYEGVEGEPNAVFAYAIVRGIELRAGGFVSSKALLKPTDEWVRHDRFVADIPPTVETEFCKRMTGLPAKVAGNDGFDAANQHADDEAAKSFDKMVSAGEIGKRRVEFVPGSWTFAPIKGPSMVIGGSGDSSPSETNPLRSGQAFRVRRKNEANVFSRVKGFRAMTKFKYPAIFLAGCWFAITGLNTIKGWSGLEASPQAIASADPLVDCQVIASSGEATLVQDQNGQRFFVDGRWGQAGEKFKIPTNILRSEIDKKISGLANWEQPIKPYVSANGMLRYGTPIGDEIAIPKEDFAKYQQWQLQMEDAKYVNSPSDELEEE